MERLQKADSRLSPGLEFSINGGSRDRITDPLVLARAKWVVEQIIGLSEPLDVFVAQQGNEVIPLRAGDSWCDARYANPVVANVNRSISSSVSDNDRFEEER